MPRIYCSTLQYTYVYRNLSSIETCLSFQILDSSFAQPILVAAGGGGASDGLVQPGEEEVHADAMGFLLEDLSMAQMIKMVPRKEGGDAGETRALAYLAKRPYQETH